jgi:hypothetical protein
MRGEELVKTKSRGGSLRFVFAALSIFAAGAMAAAQDRALQPRLTGMAPAGARSYMTNTYGAVDVHVFNPRDKDIEAEILTFYDGAPEKRFGRKTWVPANASIWSWFCVGPPGRPASAWDIELKSLLMDHSGSEPVLVKSNQNQPLTSNILPFEGREQITTLLIDTDIADGSQSIASPEEDLIAAELRVLIFSIRHELHFSQRLNVVRRRFLPPIAEAYEGIDQLVLASNRISADVGGRQALREWVQRGGRLWIPLDVVQQETVADLLGDKLNVSVIDRTTLSSVRFEMGAANPYLLTPSTTEFEKPVAFVRALAPQQQVFYTVNGWPAAFMTELGRGKVVFTTLGPRAWSRPRHADDPPSTYKGFVNLPVPLVPVQFLAQEILMHADQPLLQTGDLRPFVEDQIGYQVTNRVTILLVFGLFFLGMAVASTVLSRRGSLEHLGWLAPLLAVGAAGGFVVLGERSRSAVPPTVAVAQVVLTEPGTGDAQATGMIGVYQPGLEPSTVIGADDGGQFDLDLTGLEGRIFSRVQTDLDRWHWDNLELPTGVRLAPFKYTVPIHKPVKAVVRFGPQGVEGHVDSGPFHPLEDILLTTPGRHALPMRVNEDGTLHPSGEDSLQSGHLLTSGLLSDRQRARQSIYEHVMSSPQPHLTNRSLLLAWTDPIDTHFKLLTNARTTGMALLAIPVQFERTPPESPVTVPSTFVDCMKVGVGGRLIPAPTESSIASNTKLRFQVPDAVRPIVIESARLSVRLNAPMREVTISGFAGAEQFPLHRLSSPNGLEQLEINDPRLLQMDSRGALYVNIEVGGLRNDVDRDLWHIEWAGLEVRGRTQKFRSSEHESR